MTGTLLTPVRTLALAWIGLPVLAAILYSVGGSLQEDWRTRPPTEVEETDCRIESTMSGDNPVEVEREQRACLQAVNDAYFGPRRTRLILLSTVLLLGYAGLATALTLRYRSGPGRA